MLMGQGWRKLHGQADHERIAEQAPTPLAPPVGRSLVPAARHERRQGGWAVWQSGRAGAVLRDLQDDLHGVPPAVRLLPRHQLPGCGDRVGRGALVIEQGHAGLGAEHGEQQHRASSQECRAAPLSLAQRSTVPAQTHLARQRQTRLRRGTAGPPAAAQGRRGWRCRSCPSPRGWRAHPASWGGGGLLWAGGVGTPTYRGRWVGSGGAFACLPALRGDGGRRQLPLAGHVRSTGL